MYYFYLIKTLSGKISAFWHIRLGKIVKTAFYMSNGKKRCCFETLFFHHLPTLSCKFSGFCRRFFLRGSRGCILDGQKQQLEEKDLFPEAFSHHCHTLSEKTSAFFKNLLGIKAKSALYVSNGFVEQSKEKTFSEKKSFLRHLWSSSWRNSAFAELFPAWVPNLQSTSLKKQFE